jgi:branched-chain amino acid transport system permease protein
MSGSKMNVNTAVKGGKLDPKMIVFYVLVALAVIFTPIAFAGSGYGFVVRILCIVGIYILLALGLNIVVGYAGLLDLGYIAFYAIGAYVTAIVTQSVILFGAVDHFQKMGNKLPAGFSWWDLMNFTPKVDQLAQNPAWAQSLQWVSAHNGILPWMFILCIPLAAAGAAAAGVMLGTPVLRLRGDYLAIVTLGFGEIVRIIITNNPGGVVPPGTSTPLGGLTGGPAGLPRAGVLLPDPAGLDWLTQNVKLDLSWLGSRGFHFAFDVNLFWYYFIVIVALVTIFVVRRLDDSRLGRAWVAMREDEVAAASSGVNIMTQKLWAFSLGALSGGIAGLIYVNLQGSVTPETFNFMESVFVVSIVVLGGMGSIPGVIVGGLIIEGVPAMIQGLAGAGKLPVSPATATLIGNYRFLAFGILMVIMMALRPQGILPSSRRARELQPEVAEILEHEDQALYEAQHDEVQPSDKF